MAHTSPENLVSKRPDRAPADQAPTRQPYSVDGSSLHEVHVYRNTLIAIAPRLMGILGWSNSDDSGRGREVSPEGEIHACGSFRRQAAATAIAYLLQVDPLRKDAAFLAERVRASIIRWELGLHRRGHPVRQRTTDRASQLATASYVVQSIAETRQSQLELTIEDLRHHLAWLSGRRCDSSWADAAVVSALADGAIVLRDKALHRTARKRLVLLLKRQDEEGWFPENGAVDFGFLSLTVDALARVHHANGWEEVLEPLRKAIQFMTYFVHPDGSFGGCYGSLGTAFISPYGVELLSPLLPEAATLAMACRKRFESAVPQRCSLWNDDLTAILGASLGMTAVHTVCQPLSPGPLPCEKNGRKHFPNAGLSVVSTKTYHTVVSGKKGGAIHLTWKGSLRTLSDAGVNVLFPRTMRTSGRWDRRTKFEATDQMMSVRGILRKIHKHPPRRLRRAARRVWRRLIERLAIVVGVTQASPPKAKSSGPRLAHDFFSREIHFGENGVQINDRVECRLPCESIIFHGPTARDRDGMLDVDLEIRTSDAPRMVAGGRSVTVCRVYREGRLESSSTAKKGCEVGVEDQTSGSRVTL